MLLIGGWGISVIKFHKLRQKSQFEIRLTLEHPVYSVYLNIVHTIDIN